MIRSNHYEVAFEAYLRARGVGFVAVDEAKRGTAVPADELAGRIHAIVASIRVRGVAP